MAKEQLLINLVLARLKRGIPSDTNAHKIIEDSMDLINYDDNCTIDEIAQRIRKRISEESAPSGEDFDVWEKRIMQSMRDETERRWNRAWRRWQNVLIRQKNALLVLCPILWIRARSKLGLKTQRRGRRRWIA